MRCSLSSCSLLPLSLFSTFEILDFATTHSKNCREIWGFLGGNEDWLHGGALGKLASSTFVIFVQTFSHALVYKSMRYLLLLLLSFSNNCPLIEGSSGLVQAKYAMCRLLGPVPLFADDSTMVLKSFPPFPATPSSEASLKTYTSLLCKYFLALWWQCVCSVKALKILVSSSRITHSTRLRMMQRASHAAQCKKLNQKLQPQRTGWMSYLNATDKCESRWTPSMIPCLHTSWLKSVRKSSKCVSQWNCSADPLLQKDNYWLIARLWLSRLPWGGYARIRERLHGQLLASGISSTSMLIDWLEGPGCRILQ